MQLICFGIFVFSTCIEPFKPDIDKYESLLVVDAIITSEGGSGHVILSKTYPYDETFTTYVDGANVSLINEDGMEYNFINYKEGYYTIADSSFEAIIGEDYKIRIETTDGEICESTFETLTEPVPIDSIYYQFISGNDPKSKGLQILMNIENNEKKNVYFSWEYIETWEFEVPYASPYFEGLTTCYKTVKPAVFLIKSLKDYENRQLLAYPLYFIDNTTNRLYIKYSVLITQYTLSESAYNFLKELKEINEEQ
ncbi:MAG: DUF4249 domain-containing protein, partial [Salinivirgaceae bacterium]|nr:DUF4249 domain-containing protein [Salinivirgaceae bacterium]